MFNQLKAKLSSVSTANWLIIITGLYWVGSVIINLLATKTFGAENLISITTGGTIISWLVFMCMDIVTEVWGKKRAIKTFIASAIINLLFTALCWVCIAIPGNNPFIDDAYATVLGTGWRIAVASIIAFLAGNYLNTLIMHVMKVRSKDSNNSFGFAIRAILSTLVGQFIDNFLFYLVAFAPLGIPGTVEQSWMTILQIAGITTLIETVVEGCFVPITAKVVKYLKNKRIQEESTDAERIPV